MPLSVKVGSCPPAGSAGSTFLSISEDLFSIFVLPFKQKDLQRGSEVFLFYWDYSLY
jgi:hypothetical protein